MAAVVGPNLARAEAEVQWVGRVADGDRAGVDRDAVTSQGKRFGGRAAAIECRGASIVEDQAVLRSEIADRNLGTAMRFVAFSSGDVAA
jgi:hypothetical protein